MVELRAKAARAACGCASVIVGRKTAVSTDNLRSGNTKSCGCLRLRRLEKTRKRKQLRARKLGKAWQRGRRAAQAKARGSGANRRSIRSTPYMPSVLWRFWAVTISCGVIRAAPYRKKVTTATGLVTQWPELTT